MQKTFETTWGGKPLSITTGDIAQAANGSCVVRYGDTVVLGTAVMSSDARPGLDFFPLTVEFEERLYATGRIKGSRFIKREGRPTDEAVLTGRFIDRAIRPLFPQELRHEVQVILTVLAFDEQNDADIPGMLAAACALHMSDIPWHGPIAAARINRQKNGEFILNGTYEERLACEFDVDVAGNEEKVLMLEAGCNEAKEEEVIAAITLAQKELAPVIRLLEEVRAAVGKEKKNPIAAPTAEEQELAGLTKTLAEPLIEELFFAAPKASKKERMEAKAELKRRLTEALFAAGKTELDIKTALLDTGKLLDGAITRHLLDRKIRVDGRALNEIRTLKARVATLPCVHGSAIFERGETQVLSVCTLGAPGDKQTLDGMEAQGDKRFMHHYNFPPFSVGEAKPLRGAGRREIGHGALAEKALQYMIPPAETFPYSIRVVSEVLQSNGSSSMGSTCGASLALMDAGVPIKAPVAGIAIGVASDGNAFQVMTDLQDLEDGEGGMDFKVAGSQNGITAIQLDTKTDGLPLSVIKEALEHARIARGQVLDVMTGTLAAPRPELSPRAPRILSLTINPEKIREVIGSGGKTINEIIAKTGVTTIDIEQTGLVLITATDAGSAKAAQEWVERLTKDVVVGEQYTGTVTRLMDFGAFVEVLPGKEGLVHVSELAPWHVKTPGDIVKVGQKVQVKVVEIDEKHRINLSMKRAEGNLYEKKA